jgi:hypothetical protein
VNRPGDNRYLIDKTRMRGVVNIQHGLVEDVMARYDGATSTLKHGNRRI